MGIIDRIEENVIIAEMAGRIMREFLRSDFPEEVKAGDAFEVGEDGRITMKPEETQRRKEDVRALFEKLRKK